MTITIVLADDHPIVLRGLGQLLSLEEDMVVLAQCRDGEAVLDAVCKQRPDILLLDLQMPKKNGLEVMQALREEKCPTRVVVLTGSLEQHDANEAVRLGACGVLLKDMAPDLVVTCVRTVHAGGQWFEPRLLAQALDALARREAGLREAGASLTPREIEIVRMAVAGLRNHEIGQELRISAGTVKVHLHNIYQKIGADGRVALVRYAQKTGLI